MSTVILLDVSPEINVTTTFGSSVLAVALSGIAFSEITLLFSSVNTTLSPATTTLLVVFSVFVTVNSVRLPFVAGRTTFSFTSDVNVPFIVSVGLFVADAPLSISIPLFVSVPLNPKCKSITSTLPPFTRTPPYLKPTIETLFNTTVAPSYACTPYFGPLFKFMSFKVSFPAASCAVNIVWFPDVDVQSVEPATVYPLPSIVSSF